MCIECGYIGEVQESIKKFDKGYSSNSDLLQELTATVLKYWKEVAEDSDEDIKEELSQKGEK